MTAIGKEGPRLQRAAHALDERKKATAEVKRLETPLATAKRFFSAKVRQEYVDVQGRYERADGNARGLGVTSINALQEQRARWESSKARLPGLEAKASFLSKTLERATKALAGSSWSKIESMSGSTVAGARSSETWIGADNSIQPPGLIA